MTVGYFSFVRYLSEGGTNQLFTIPFPYLAEDNIYVFVKEEDEDVVQLNDWEFLTPTQIQINVPVNSGVEITIRRVTRRDERLAHYFNGATLTEDDLNIVTKQLLYLIQELFDYLTTSNLGDPIPGGPGGPGDPGGGGDPGDIIDEIIDEILNSQLFRDLIELIELVDINAETIMSQILSNHAQWSQDHVFDGLIAQLDEGLEDIDARFIHEVAVLHGLNEQRVTEIHALQTRMGSAEADIIEVFTSVAAVDHAMTEYIAVASSRFEANEARIGVIESTYASTDYVEAYVHQQLDATFTQSNIDTFINASSYINAIRVRADAQGSSVAAITSYVAGAGATINPNGTINWPANPGGLAGGVSAVQQTVNVHATQLQTEAAFRQALASRFMPGGANQPAPLVSAIEQAWRTYADVESTTAQRVLTLESNRQPIFFRETAPNPWGAEFQGTPFTVFGFPRGSLWYKQFGNKHKPFYWYPGLTTAPPGSDEFYGPFLDVNNQPRPGVWGSFRDDAMADVLGARISSVESTMVTPEEVRAEVETTLTTVFNAPNINAVQAIAQRMTSYVNPTNGIMYSSWQVRINQYLNGNPVIAGVGLGMQSDPNNPQGGAVSTFIVMADRFAVIKPPTIDPLGGPLDLNSVVVPFVIDGATQTVGINGRLLVKGSLGAYDGAVGRIMATQLNSDARPTNVLGRRMLLASRFNNYNSSNLASPFTGTFPQRFHCWAGEGEMNHNNAKFYVDEEGNGYFAGIVSADNIAGGINDGTMVNQTFPKVNASGSGWTTLPGTPVLESPSGRERKAMAFITVEITDSNGNIDPVAGRARLELNHEISPGVWSGTWTQVAETAAVGAGSVTATLAGALPFPVNGRVRMRVSIARQRYSGQDRYPGCTYYSGLLVGLR